jgi:hypothetical protein
MLEGLFGNETIESILFYIIKNESTYAAELSKIFDRPISIFQSGLGRLERGSVLSSQKVGNTRVYSLNPTYIFKESLTNLIKDAYSTLPTTVKLKYYERDIRKRPRRPGKPL